MTTNEDALNAAAHALGQSPAFRDAVWRHHPDHATNPAALPPSMRIHAEDQMLRHSLRGWGEVNASLTQYYNVALQQHSAARQALHRLFGAKLDQLAVLDFACGWGRLLRFLVRTVPPSNIWASDIQHDAVDFVSREFGVHGIYSDADPDAFKPDRQFDFIWVASLFSHLPADLFRAWLAKLTSVLSPRGVLAFSVHDERLRPAGAAMPSQGILYTTTSEIEELDSSVYGTSFVSEAYVAKTLAEANGGKPRPYKRLPRGLANEQDLYVVPRDPARDLAVLDGFRRGAWGCVDAVRTSARYLEMVGWAASLDDGPLDAVTVRVGEREYRCPITVPREDVPAALGEPGLKPTGWEFFAPLEADESFVVATATSRQGEQVMLYAGPVKRGARRGPWGSVDVVRAEGRELRLSGWAASADDGPIDAVTIRVGAREHRCPIDVDRDDVAAAMNDPGMKRSGWEFRAPLDAAETRVVVTATSARGETTELYSGVVHRG